MSDKVPGKRNDTIVVKKKVILKVIRRGPETPKGEVPEADDTTIADKNLLPDAMANPANHKPETVARPKNIADAEDEQQTISESITSVSPEPRIHHSNPRPLALTSLKTLSLEIKDKETELSVEGNDSDQCLSLADYIIQAESKQDAFSLNRVSVFNYVKEDLLANIRNQHTLAIAVKPSTHDAVKAWRHWAILLVSPILLNILWLVVSVGTIPVSNPGSANTTLLNSEIGDTCTFTVVDRTRFLYLHHGFYVLVAALMPHMYQDTIMPSPSKARVGVAYICACVLYLALLNACIDNYPNIIRYVRLAHSLSVSIYLSFCLSIYLSICRFLSLLLSLCDDLLHCDVSCHRPQPHRSPMQRIRG